MPYDVVVALLVINVALTVFWFILWTTERKINKDLEEQLKLSDEGREILRGRLDSARNVHADRLSDIELGLTRLRDAIKDVVTWPETDDE